MAEYFTEELNELDERIECEKDGGIVNAQTNRRESSDEAEGSRRPKTASDRLFNLSLTVLANINAGMMLKPSKKKNKLIEKLNPPVDPTLSNIASRIDCG